MKLKYIKHLALCLALALTLTLSAVASPVPDSFAAENLNGQQRITKTYVLPPDADPELLKEPPYDYGGFSYTWAYTTKEEHPVRDSKTVTQAVTVETSTKDLSAILAQLPPTMEYDDGTWFGTLALDHTSIQTEAAGYTTKSSTVTDTRIIGPLDRNDMSYIPATVEKNGVTLNLASVDWQVIGMELAGEIMLPCSYQAAATYTGKSYYSAATGYVTTASYVGEVIREGVESITYRVTYLGTELVPAEPEPGSAEDGEGLLQRIVSSPNFLRSVLCMLGGVAVVALAILLIMSRREVRRLRAEDAGTHENEEESV